MPDPFHILPLELICLIAAYFDHAEFWRLQRTSKAWLQTLTSKDIVSMVGRSYATHCPSDSIGVEEQERASHMANHLRGLPFGLIHLPGSDSDLTQSLPLNVPLRPILKGRLFVYEEQPNRLRMLNLQNGQTNVIDSHANHMVLTDEVFAYVTDGLYVKSLDALHRPPTFRSIDLEDRVINMAGHKSLIVILQCGNRIVLCDTRDPSTELIKLTIPGISLHNHHITGRGSREIGYQGMIVDAEKRVCHVIRHAHGPSGGRRVHVLLVTRLSFDREHFETRRFYYRVAYEKSGSVRPRDKRTHLKPSGQQNEWELCLYYSEGQHHRILLNLDNEEVSVRRIPFTGNIAIWKDTCYVQKGKYSIQARNIGPSAVRGKIEDELQPLPGSDDKVNVNDGEILINDSFLVDYTPSNPAHFTAYTFDRASTTCPVSELRSDRWINVRDHEQLKPSMERSIGLEIAPALACPFTNQKELKFNYSQVPKLD